MENKHGVQKMISYVVFGYDIKGKSTQKYHGVWKIHGGFPPWYHTLPGTPWHFAIRKKKTMARSRFHRQRLPNQVTVMGKKLPNWRGFVMIYSNQKATKKIDMVWFVTIFAGFAVFSILFFELLIAAIQMTRSNPENQPGYWENSVFLQWPK